MKETSKLKFKLDFKSLNKMDRNLNTNEISEFCFEDI